MFELTQCKEKVSGLIVCKSGLQSVYILMYTCNKTKLYENRLNPRIGM